MTAFDRQQVIETASRKVGHHSGQAAVARALPVIVAAVLKPIRELHRPHPYADAELRSVSPSLPEFVCTHCATPSGRAVAFPCPTVRLLDEIKAAAKGGE